MKTVLAAIVAVALIAGALYVRTEFIVGPEGPVVADGSEAPPPPAEGVRIACDALLADACPPGAQRLGLGELLEAFSGQQTPHDVVIAPSVVIDLIEASQTSQARFGEEREVIATTPLIAVVQQSRVPEVADACGATVTWGCVGELLEEGVTSTAFPDPRAATDGLAVIAALAGGFFDNTSYNANAFGDAAFLGWRDGVRAASVSDADPVNTLIQFSGARNDSAITIEASGLATAQRGALRTATEVYWPTPLAVLSVVAVGVGGTTPADAAAEVASTAEALGAAGWRDPGGAPLEAGPPLEGDDDGLPTGGVLFSLRREWN